MLQEDRQGGPPGKGQAHISVQIGDQCLPPQALGDTFKLGEIDMPASQADRFARRIAQGGPTRANPAIGEQVHYAGSGLLCALADRLRRFPIRMNTLIANTHAGKMSVNHTLKLMVSSSISAST